MACAEIIDRDNRKKEYHVEKPAPQADLGMALGSLHLREPGSEEAHSRGHAASVGIDAGAVPRYQCATLKGSVTSDHDSGASLFFAGAVAGSASTPADEEEPAEFVWMFSVRTRRDFESPGEARVLTNACLAEWEHICQTISPIKKMGFEANATALFEAYMLVSHNPRAGCVLVAGFQHVLGDASSYALFLRRWSDIYKARLDEKVRDLLQNSETTAVAEGSADAAATAAGLTARATTFPSALLLPSLNSRIAEPIRSRTACDNSDAHLLLHKLMPLELPAGVFSTPAPSSTRNRPARLTDKYRDEGGVLFRRFTFSAQTLHALKASVGTGDNCNIVLTTNDLLMAQCACGMAPSRLAALRVAQGIAGKGTSDADPINSPARIVVLADHRGRGIEQGTWGNHSVDLSIYISFRLLISGDVAAVARAIHGAIRHELQKLEHDLTLYNFEKKLYGGRSKLFLWNSWARVGHALRAVRFGGVEDSLQMVEWLNVQVLDALPGEVIVAISPSHTQGLTVGVVSAMPSAREDLDLLSSSPFWSLAAVSD